MNDRCRCVAQAVFTAVFLCAGIVRAADRPTTEDCIEASDASIQASIAHKLRAARAHFLVCAASSCPADIRKECIRRVDETNAAIPTIIFEAKDESGADVSAVRVTMDGELITDRLEGTAVPIDPGSHTFVFETAGKPALTKRFVIRESQKDRNEVVVFAPAPTPAPSVPVAKPAGPLPSTPDLNASSESAGLGTQKILAIVAASIGVVGLGIGGVTGALALSEKSDAEKLCPKNPCGATDVDGVNKWKDAVSMGNISTVGFIVGAAGIVGGAVLWFTAPGSRVEPSTQIGFGPGSIRVRATW